MATLTPESLYGNIFRSLQRYLTEQVVTPLGIPVRFPLTHQLPSVANRSVPRWIDADYFGLEGATQTMVIREGLATWGQFLVNLNLFEFDDQRTSVFSLAELADTICQIFATASGIPIYDYGTLGTPRVGALRVTMQPYPNPIQTPDDSGVSQYNISVNMRYSIEVMA